VDWARGGEAQRAEAAARHQSRAKQDGKKNWEVFPGVYPSGGLSIREFVHPGVHPFGRFIHLGVYPSGSLSIYLNTGSSTHTHEPNYTHMHTHTRQY